MKKTLKAIIKKPFIALAEFLNLIFESAAENHIRLQRKIGSNGKAGKFSSYSQFKRYQSKMRKFFLLAVLFAFGMLFSQVIFPSTNRSEVFIPEGEGEILTSNISRNGATVVFKTLDAANFNKPLATVAQVQVFQDPELRQLVKTTDPDDYAVTHMISISGLDDNKDYYLRIIATDSSVGNDVKKRKELAYVVGKDGYLRVHTGNQIGQQESCEEKLAKEVSRINRLLTTDAQRSAVENGDVQFLPNSLEEAPTQKDSDGLEISNVMNESALYEREKVQTIVSWRTNRPSSTTAIYREGKAGEEREVAIGNKFDVVHMAVFTNFKPGTVYYFKVKSVDENGKAAVSEEFSLLTPKRNQSMTEVVLNDFKQFFKQIIPTK